jgi:hypothetical protein
LFRFFLFFSSGLFLKWTIRDINWRPVTPSSDWYLGFFFFRLSLQHAYYCYLRLITLWPGRGNLIFFCLSNYSCTTSVCVCVGGDPFDGPSLTGQGPRQQQHKIS